MRSGRWPCQEVMIRPDPGARRTTAGVVVMPRESSRLWWLSADISVNVTPSSPRRRVVARHASCPWAV